MSYVRSPLADCIATRTVSVTAPRAGTPQVCRRALVDRDCPFTHDWQPEDGGYPGSPRANTDVPFTRSPHDVRSSSEGGI